MTAPAQEPEPDAELAALREQVAACDRALLAALNRRIELVRQVRRHLARLPQVAEASQGRSLSLS